MNVSLQKPIVTSLAVLFESQATAPSPVTYVWGVNMESRTFRHSTGAWKWVPGEAIKQVSMGADGSLWALTQIINRRSVRNWL
jgi:hypothetical protein